MRIKILSLLLLSFLASASVKNGEIAPIFSLLNQDNESVSLDEFKGKKIILEWTNHDCPFVKRHYDTENMQTIQKDMTDNEIIWLSIVSSAEGKQGYVTNEQAKKLTSKRNAHPTHVLLDTNGDVGKMFSAKTTPHMYIIDEEGILKYQGAIDDAGGRGFMFKDLLKAKNYIKNGLLELNKGDEITSPITKPYGCSVKYAS